MAEGQALHAAARALRSRAPTIALVGLAVAAVGLGLAQILSLRVALRLVLGPLFTLEVAGLLAGLAAALTALVAELRAALRGEVRARPLAPARRLLVVIVTTWILFLALVQPYQRLWLVLALGLAAGSWAALLSLEHASGRPAPRLLRAADLTLFVLATSVVLLEVGLRGLAAVRPSPLLARVSDAPGRFVDRFRCDPGELRFGFPCNERGFYDGPLEPRRPGEPLVAAIGDSFNVGAVPHAWHYTSVCEKRLSVPVHNLGVAGSGPPEYRYLLVEEALPLDPGILVIALFVGNDLSYAEAGGDLADPGLRAWLERESVLAWVVPQRLARLAAERRRAGADTEPVASVQGERTPLSKPDAATLVQAMPWLADPLLEQPTLSPDAFLRLETQRALDVCRGEPASLRELCSNLGQMRALAGERPLVVLLIPDEFQVEDALWQAVLVRAGVALDRDQPQRLLRAWLEREGIACLDLLGALRAVPPLQDGQRHVYHLRDTHFNARGNAVAGEALADFLRPLLAR